MRLLGGPCVGMLLVACSSRTGEIPDQLETLVVDVSGPPAAMDQAFGRSGTAHVEGSGRDFRLVLDDVDVKLHSPGMSDLSSLEGRTIDASFSTADFATLNRAVVLETEDGIAFAADYGGGRAFVETWLGAGFVDWGKTVGTESRDDRDWEYTTAAFATDDGSVEMLPGEVRTLRFGGASFRVVVVAAYRSTPDPDAELEDCGGSLDDLLSYELYRVDAPVTAPRLVRPAGMSIAAIGCGFD